jgi:hypothetical protein
MELKQTDTIVARYAKLPVLEPSHRYLVKVMEPLELCEIEKKITYEDMRRFEVIPKGDKYSKDDWNAYALEALKKLLLEEWHGYVKDLEWMTEEDAVWVLKLDKVELIECDLLVPKKKGGKNEIPEKDLCQ